MRLLKDLTLRAKLMLAMLFAALIPLLLVTSISFFTAERDIFNLQINQLQVINQKQIEIINQFINTIDRKLKEVQTDPIVLKSIENVDKYIEDRASMEYQTARNALNKILQPMQRASQFEDVYLINLSGKIVYASDTGHAWQYLGKSLAPSLQWSHPNTQYGFSYTPLFLNTIKSGNYDFLVKAPLYDQKGKIHGNVVFEVSLLPIYNIIGPLIGLGETGESILLERKNEENVQILSPLRFNKLAVLEILPFRFIPKKNYVEFDDYRNQKSIGILGKTSKIDFDVLTMINKEEMLASIHNLMYKNNLIVLAAALFVILLSLWLSKQITRPLQSLAKATMDLKEKNFDVEIDKKLLSSRDEIGTLAQAFQQMIEELSNYYQSLMNMIKKVEEAKEEAISANNAKSQFLTNMSHELRTPLNAIMGYSELLAEEAQEKHIESFVSDLDKISTSAKQLLEMINEILDLSKIEAGKTEVYLEEILIAPFVSMVGNMIRPTILKNNNTFVIDCPLENRKMTTDATRVRQCLLNLLSNAGKFTSNGEVRLSVSDEQDWIDFSVHDTGIGITELQLSKLFQPFTQAEASTTRRFGGTGLGLYLTKNYTETLGGTLTAKSIPGKGSTFTIRLPLISKKIIK